MSGEGTSKQRAKEVGRQEDKRKVESSDHLTKSSARGGPASGEWGEDRNKERGEEAWCVTSQAARETEARNKVTRPHLQVPEASRAWGSRDSRQPRLRPLKGRTQSRV